MSWRTDDVVHVICPRCGQLVIVPVEIRSVDLIYPGDEINSNGKYARTDKQKLRVWFNEKAAGPAHHCIITDGQMPVDRFVATGALDSVNGNGRR